MFRSFRVALKEYSSARQSRNQIESNEEKKTHHEGHEGHEQRKLTTKGAKSFQSEISEAFVSFVIFVVRISFVMRCIYEEYQSTPSKISNCEFRSSNFSNSETLAPQR